MKNKQLANWEKAVIALTELFVGEYFDKEADWYFVGDDIGGVLVVNDYFFNLDRIVEAIKYKATEKQLFDFYDLELQNLAIKKQMEMNFRNYINYYNGFGKFQINI